MKKSILMTWAILATFSLTAFGFINLTNAKTSQCASPCVKVDKSQSLLFSPYVELDETDFLYDVGTRFRGVKKSTLENAKSISDFLSINELQSVEHYYSVSVIIIENDKQTDIRKTGENDVLTIGQLDLLRSADYSTNFLVRADYQGKNIYTGFMEDNYFSPHMTIVPEKQAVYLPGKDAFIDYLAENNKKNIVHLDKSKLHPAKLYFTVTKKGEISKIKLGRTSGYPEIDKNMINLLTTAPGKWAPAENAKGKKVDQELVISFGLIGC